MHKEKQDKMMTWGAHRGSRVMRGARRTHQKAVGKYGGWYSNIGEAKQSRIRVEHGQTTCDKTHLQKHQIWKMTSHCASTSVGQTTCLKCGKRGRMELQLLELTAWKKTKRKVMKQACGSTKAMEETKSTSTLDSSWGRRWRKRMATQRNDHGQYG